MLVATDDEEKKLRRELLVTGCAIDVKDYTPKHNDNLEPGNNNIMGMYTIINLWHEFTWIADNIAVSSVWKEKD